MKPHPVGGAIFQFAIGISVEGYIRCADLILQWCKRNIQTQYPKQNNTKQNNFFLQTRRKINTIFFI